MILWHTHIIFLYFLPAVVTFASGFQIPQIFSQIWWFLLIIGQYLLKLYTLVIMLWNRNCYPVFLQMVKLRCREIKSLYCRELSGMAFPIIEKCLICRSESCKQTEKWCMKLITTVGTEEQLHRETGAMAFYCLFLKKVLIIRFKACWMLLSATLLRVR